MIYLNTGMILRTPQLALKRLVIQSRGVSVYDERFRHGINIIRGTNSSGKSTITDFIFYILGGELAQFKQAAEKCEEVIGEVEINGKLITIRRIVAVGGKQPMIIAFSDFETAMKSPVEGWQVYSMVRSASKESASQAVFHLLGFPEVKTDTDNSITMHQVLRLIYADQVSSPSSLMRDELFDPYLVRQTVGDLLFGVYDDLLFGELYELREKTKALEAVSHQLQALYKVLGGTDIEIDEVVLNQQLETLNGELAQIDKSLRNASSTQIDKKVSGEIKRRIDELTSDFRALKIEESEKSEQGNAIELEIADSEAFIYELKVRIAAIDDSLTTRRFLGELPLTHCPECLSELKKPEGERLCPLCGNQLPDNPNDSGALKMKQELGQQLKESQILLNDKIKALTQLQVDIPRLNALVKIKRRQYEEAVEKVRPERDEMIDQLFIRKGELTAEIEEIARQIKTASIVKAFEKSKADLAASINLLNFSIERRKHAQLERRIVGERGIESNTIIFLREDLPRQDEFKVGKQVKVDFVNNTFSFDGQNQFSASSVAYLKNSVHFGIFFASLDLDFFRYPRFIMCDNIEDKGLEQDRSRNFQKIMVALSEKSKTTHQIIFSTSMIDPSLNNEKYCVGLEYNVNRKSLDFSKLAHPQ